VKCSSLRRSSGCSANTSRRSRAPITSCFTTRTGRGRNYRHVDDVFRLAVERAGSRGQGRLSLNSLRHGYAGMLITKPLHVVFLSRQLGHAKANLRGKRSRRATPPCAK
jgi:hypothetical protein